MKLTKQTLKRIIKEELQNIMEVGESDYFSKEKDARAFRDKEYLDKEAQASRVKDNDKFLATHKQASKEASTIFDLNKSEIYKIVIDNVKSSDRVRSTIGKGKVSTGSVHDLINKAIDHAGSVRVGQRNLDYFNAILHHGSREAIEDYIGKSEGQKKLNIVRKMKNGEDNDIIALHVYNYIKPVLDSYLDETRGFMQKAGSFIRGKGYRE
jgi:hypothetical protein